MIILSIQSHVAYGHVGNAAATFPLQRIGVEVWPIHTVQFSNHTGYGAWKGQVFDAALITGVMEGIEQRGVLGECDGVLSGYLGSVATGEAILDAAARVKMANPVARYCCDPVLGDVEQGLFVPADVAEFIKCRAAPSADMITPNHFELEFLCGRKLSWRAEAATAAEAMINAGTDVVFVTSLRTGETPDQAVDVLACDRSGRYVLRTPLLPTIVSGAGDAIAALFFADYLRTGSVAEASSYAVSAVFSILSRTAEAGSSEMLLVEAQDELVNPSHTFRAQRI